MAPQNPRDAVIRARIEAAQKRKREARIYGGETLEVYAPPPTDEAAVSETIEALTFTPNKVKYAPSPTDEIKTETQNAPIYKGVSPRTVLPPEGGGAEKETESDELGDRIAALAIAINDWVDNAYQGGIVGKFRAELYSPASRRLPDDKWNRGHQNYLAKQKEAQRAHPRWVEYEEMLAEWDVAHGYAEPRCPFCELTAPAADQCPACGAEWPRGLITGHQAECAQCADEERRRIDNFKRVEAFVREHGNAARLCAAHGLWWKAKMPTS